MTDRIELDRRAVLAGLVAAGGAVALPKGARAQADTPKPGGNLRVAIPFNPAALDPMTGRNSPDFNTLYAIFDALIDFDPDTLELRPGLAKSWSFDTPTTLTLMLQQGVTFHDGTPFDADAVKFNLDRSKNDKRSLVKSDTAPIDSVEVVDQGKVVLHLNRPAASLPSILTDRIGCMVSPKSVKDAGPDGNVDRNPVGTGAWKFVEWEAGDHITMTRNPNYWKAGQPHLDGMKFSIISDLSTGLRSVIAGENDLAINLQITQKPVADAAANIRSAFSSSTIYQGGFLNLAKPPLDNKLVRQALMYGVNRAEFDQVISLGHGEPACSVVPKEHWACDPATYNFYPYDPDKAKALLTQAGFPNGVDVPAIGWPDTTSVRRQELVVAQAAKAGLRIHVTPVSDAESMRMFMIEQQGAMTIGPSGGRPDPGQFYGQLFAKEGFFNASHQELPGFHDLLAATDAAPDLATRKQAFVALQRFVVDNAMVLVMDFIPNFWVYAPNVHAYNHGLLGRPKFHGVWMS